MTAVTADAPSRLRCAPCPPQPSTYASTLRDKVAAGHVLLSSEMAFLIKAAEAEELGLSEPGVAKVQAHLVCGHKLWWQCNCPCLPMGMLGRVEF